MMIRIWYYLKNRRYYTSLLGLLMLPGCINSSTDGSRSGDQGPVNEGQTSMALDDTDIEPWLKIIEKIEKTNKAGGSRSGGLCSSQEIVHESPDQEAMELNFRIKGIQPVSNDSKQSSNISSITNKLRELTSAQRPKDRKNSLAIARLLEDLLQVIESPDQEAMELNSRIKGIQPVSNDSKQSSNISSITNKLRELTSAQRPKDRKNSLAIENSTKKRAPDQKKWGSKSKIISSYSKKMKKKPAIREILLRNLAKRVCQKGGQK